MVVAHLQEEQVGTLRACLTQCMGHIALYGTRAKVLQEELHFSIWIRNRQWHDQGRVQATYLYYGEKTNG